MNEHSRDTSRSSAELRRPDPDHRRFLGMELWQQIIAGLIVLAIAGIVSHLILDPHKQPTPPPSRGPTNSGRTTPVPTPGPTKLGRTTPASGTTWLDQLTPTSGEVSSSQEAPQTGSGAGQPAALPHELLVPSSLNGNVVSYNLDDRYKMLNLTVAVPGDTNSSGGATLEVGLDGKTYPLDNPSSDAYFYPVLTAPMEWTLNVAGGKTLQVAVTAIAGQGAGTALLVSGSLTG
jgi:hypothetical protein